MVVITMNIDQHKFLFFITELFFFLFVFHWTFYCIIEHLITCICSRSSSSSSSCYTNNFDLFVIFFFFSLRFNVSTTLSKICYKFILHNIMVVISAMINMCYLWQVSVSPSTFFLFFHSLFALARIFFSLYFFLPFYTFFAIIFNLQPFFFYKQ